MLVLSGFGLFVSLSQFGCAGKVSIHELHRPVVDSPFAEGLLNPNQLSSETRAMLAAAGLSRIAKKDVTAVIRTLSESLESNAEDLDTRLALAELCEDHAEKIAPKLPEVAIGFYLTAAETAFPVLGEAEVSQTHRELVALYNECCAEAAMLLFRSEKIGESNRSIDGPIHSFTVSTDLRGHGNAHPHFFDEIHPASVLKIKGFEAHHRQAGVGGALVGYREGTPERRETNPFLSPFGMAEPLSATLEFHDGGKVALAYHDVLSDDEVRLLGKNFPLEADFTATVATLLSHEPAKNLGWEGMLHPEDCLKYQGLYLLHEFRPDKIPVVLVHGLMSSPDTWKQIVSDLYADPDLRSRFQFLVYQYPTGFPIPHNAAGLRRYLQQFTETYDPRGSNPRMKQMVMIGHSMGGLLTSMQIRDGGDPVWYAIHPKSVENLEVSEKHQETLKELVYFKSNPNITRAVFVCAPHRGSDIANNPIGEFGASLIKQPFERLEDLGPKLSGESSELEDTFLHYPTNGIVGLKAHSEVLEKIVALPVRPGITFHSIIGDRGKGGDPDTTSDGVVAYWSTHLDGADSEHLVGASHVEATSNGGTADEIRRILYLHAGEPMAP